jgi:hypothetical protein
VDETKLASIVVGALNVVGLAVKGTLKLVMGRVAVIPVACASTVVARLLAVPQPYW